MTHNDFAIFAGDTSSILTAWIIASCIVAAQHSQSQSSSVKFSFVVVCLIVCLSVINDH